MNENEKYIGVFDSGIGGLTVVKSIVEAMPKENIIYFGDTAHVPYGTRSRQQITEYVLADVRFLHTFPIKAVVIACNTADAVARSAVEQQYPATPVFGVVQPAAAAAAEATKNNRIGVIATNATVRSRAYENAIRPLAPDAQVIAAACPLLVPLVEEGRFHKGDPVTHEVLREYLLPLRNQGIDTLVLGCTHYPLLHDMIAEILPEVTIISSSAAAARTLQNALAEKKLLNTGDGGKRQYFVSDAVTLFAEQASVFMGDALGGTVEHADPEMM